uniref:S-adenosylmethionine:diacylglycerol 3-amino-3-carboxypropyl transferase n=1 Tax=uncultured marine microorganism TaxID=415540 RepID=A5CFR7_9ZZZZ|nr:hypothetical protein [uncultured marine microorganism]
MAIRSEIAEKADFAGIRYAQCWEDADVLLEALQVDSVDTCLSVASAGDNTLALVGAGAKRIIAADLSPAQIACLELRVAAYRNLKHAEFLELLGQNASEQRLDLYSRCRSDLSASARGFWDERHRLIRLGIAYCGKFERYLTMFRRFVLPLVHRRKKVDRLFEMSTVQERHEFYEREWNTYRWILLCKFLFGNAVLGHLGRDPTFTRFADESVAQSLQRRIPYALIKLEPQKNPYLQWILAGRFVSALPYALRPENFDRIRQNLDSLEWHCASVEEVISQLPDDVLHCCNLSNIFEYVSPESYERMLGEIIRVSAPGCRLVYWNVVVQRHCPPVLAHRLRQRRDIAVRLHRKDKAFFYRDLIIEEVV